MIILLLTVLASLGALAGGFVAIRARKNLQIVMALTSGLVLGLVAFDLLPEVFSAAGAQRLNPAWPMALFVVGFLLFHSVEKFVLIHEADETEYSSHRHPKLGYARAAALVGHSFMDGLSIGVAFQVSTTVGYAVALAVIGHRFADGFDTSGYMIFSGNKLSSIKKFLGVVVIMPVIGGLVSLVLPFTETALALYLGFFAGVIMYIAASNILPQAHSKAGSYLTLLLTVVGAAFMFVVTRFV